MPSYWISPAGLWSSPTATATTTSGYYSPWGSNSSTATTSNSVYMHNIWYTNQETIAWTAVTPSTDWGLASPAQDVWYPQALENWIRRRAPRLDIHSPALRSRCLAVAERYAREVEAAVQLERQHAAIQAHSDESKKRALDLLLEHLNPTQRETFRRNSWFIVEGRRSGTRYRINGRGNLAGNIDVLRNEPTGPVISNRLCAHCDIGMIPLGDQLLAQKLMLEFDEDTFLQIANRHAA